MKTRLLFSLLILGSTASAVEMKVSQCWKGYSQSEQNAHYATCKAAKGSLDFCSTNWGEHGGAVYDVCKMTAVRNPTKIVTLYKGYRQSEQDKNLKECQKSEALGKLCVSDWGVHKQALYDIALME